MAFKWHDVESEEDFCAEADPALKKLMKRKAGASVMQDIGLNTYWANIAGKTRLSHPGATHMYQKELKENLAELMNSKMSYREMEEFMVILGYEAGDIRCAFKCGTGVDPEQLDYLRAEDVKNTPSNIPWYNLGWGLAKTGESSFFVMPYANNMFSMFEQVDDMTRKEVDSFIRHDEAIEALGKKVKRVHRYDMPVGEAVEDNLSKHVQEPQKKEYQVLANYIEDLTARGEMDVDMAKRLVRDAVSSGSITLEEGSMMLSVRADTNFTDDVMPNPQHTENTPTDKGADDVSDAQSRRVLDEMDKATPQEFFESELPDRVEQAAGEHVKDVLSYISNRESEIGDFDVRLYSMKYKRTESSNTVVGFDPSTGRAESPPSATITTILEIQDKTLPEGKSKKFGLTVFFVGADGNLGTSDSIKGEDDILYGFSEDGLRQYFAKERMSGEEMPEGGMNG